MLKRMTNLSAPRVVEGQMYMNIGGTRTKRTMMMCEPHVHRALCQPSDDRLLRCNKIIGDNKDDKGHQGDHATVGHHNKPHQVSAQASFSKG